MKTSCIKKILSIMALMLSIAASTQAYTPIGGTLTNYTFTSGTTYYITNFTQLYGSCVLEGGAVLKFAPGMTLHLPYSQQLNVDHNGTVYLTAVDDNTVGESIGTGSPSGYYFTLALDGEVFLDNCNVSYCNYLILYGATDYIYYCDFNHYNSSNLPYIGGATTVYSYGDYLNGSPYTF